MKGLNSIFGGCLVLWLGLPIVPAAADSQEGDWKHVHAHGFFSQNFLYSNKNKFFGNSDDGSIDFFELGGNAKWNLNSNFGISGQVLIRDAGESDDSRPRVDYLFATYDFLKDEDNFVSLKFGRVLNQYGLFNATRDIAATRPGILLPQSIYPDANRSFAISSDGVLIQYARAHEKGRFTLDVAQGKPRTRGDELEVSSFGGSVPGRLQGDKSSWTAKLEYEHDFGRWRVAWTQAEVYETYKPGEVDSLADGEIFFKPMLLSFQYQEERWGVTAEYLRRKSGGKNFGIPDVEFEGDNFYIQGDYRVGAFSYFARYDQLVRDNDDRWGKKYELATGRPAFVRYARDWTIGARWDINQHLLLNAELHAVEGAAWLSPVENNGMPAHKYWNLFLMSVSARF